eukprot:50921-Eustigmatos_ZCMA.PRE.2
MTRVIPVVEEADLRHIRGAYSRSMTRRYEDQVGPQGYFRLIMIMMKGLGFFSGFKGRIWISVAGRAAEQFSQPEFYSQVVLPEIVGEAEAAAGAGPP